MQAAMKAQAEAEAAEQNEARQFCLQSWKKSPRLTTHPYATRKRVQLYGQPIASTVEAYPGWLQVPLQDTEGVIHSAQLIAENGSKRFVHGGRIKGCFIPIHGPADEPIILCEGYATGCSIHQATGWQVACACSRTNLAHVAKALRAQYPDRLMILAADNDQFTEGNPGLTDAISAASTTKGYVACPQFADEALADKPTDFNDLAMISGPAEVERQIVTGLPRRNFYRCRIDHAFNPLITPPRRKAIFTLRDCVICTPGNLAVIASQVKTGKSSLVSAMNAATLSSTPHPDFLGFTSTNPEGGAVLHFDTEQSPDDHWWQTKRTLIRAGLEQPPEWFHTWHLIGMSWSEAWQFILDALPFYARKFNGLHSVQIDGIGDTVPSVNDEVTCLARVSQLLDLAGQYQCPITTVLHFNPASNKNSNFDKTRGHLGSQLERKSETNLRLDKNCTGVIVWSEKQRHQEIPKSNPIHFHWSDEHQMHILTDPKDLPPAGARTKAGRKPTIKDDEIISLLKDQSLSYSEWFKAVQDAQIPCSSSSFDLVLTRLREADKVSKDPVSGKWRMHLPHANTP